MANGNSIELAVVAAGVATSDFLSTIQKGGRLRVASGSYVLAATLAAGGAASTDSINLFTVPKGARILCILCVAGASHGSAQPKIGDAADDDKYRVAAAITTLGCSIQSTAAAQCGAAVEGVTIPYTAETTIVLTNTNSAFPTGGEYVHWFGIYVVD